MMKKKYSYKVTFILFFMLNIITSVCYNIDNEKIALLSKRILYAFINSFGVSALLVGIIFLFRHYLKLNLRNVFLILLFLILIIESFTLIKFDSLITPSVILVSIETNMQEIAEFVNSAYFDFYTCLILFLILIIAVAVFFFIHKFDSFRFPAFLRRTKLNVALATIGALVYILLSYYAVYMRNIISYPSLTGIERLYYSLKITLHDRVDYKRMMELVKKNTPQVKTVAQGVPNIVLILGESLSKIHMGCYGYVLPTTPYLDDRIRKSEIFRFDSVKTNNTVTVEALKAIMSFYNRSSIKNWYEYYMLPTVMKAAGYNTFWLSNQESFGVANFNISAAIATSAEHVIYTHQRHTSEDKVGYFDEELLPIIDSCIRSDERNFYVCHLMGSHWRYANRYPADFDKFKPENIVKELKNSQKEIVAEYDNSVLYNDYIVNEIIKRFENTESIIFYFPDHGEEVFDSQNMNGHRLDNPTDNMTEIPFLIWTSEALKKNYPLLITRIEAAVSNCFYTENIIHTILDIGGIEADGYDASKSLFYNTK